MRLDRIASVGVNVALDRRDHNLHQLANRLANRRRVKAILNRNRFFFLFLR